MIHAALPVLRPRPLFGVAATRRIERDAISASEPQALMQGAGVAVARLALAVAPHAKRVWVAAGPGNNGGDGIEAAIHLHRAGKPVAVTLLGDAATQPADAATALHRARAAGVPIGVSCPDDLDVCDLAIDALLGIGVSRAPQGPLAALIRSLNAMRCPVLAIDVPSGLSADTGQPFDAQACVVAHHTLSLLTLKPGLFTGAGRDHAGRVWLDALGIEPSLEAPDAWLVGAGDRGLSMRRHAQHKGSFGDVAIVGGAHGMSGAALLAARAAHAAGAGRVYVALLDDSETALAVDPVRPELMFRPRWWQAESDTLSATTVVCGCGGGDAVREPLPRLLSRAARLVIDADALNAVAADPLLQSALQHRAGRRLASVLTPHPLEAARLLGCSTADVQADRLKAAQALATRFGCVVVLKGSGTVIAAPGQTPRINSTGNASLASAGTGDVLAGWIGGLWAQATTNDAATTAFDIATSAVAQHGAAADPHHPGPLRAGDLIDALYRDLRGA